MIIFYIFNYIGIITHLMNMLRKIVIFYIKKEQAFCLLFIITPAGDINNSLREPRRSSGDAYIRDIHRELLFRLRYVRSCGIPKR